ncbi:uncharacterized protein LOC117609807 isoform X4 [Osmia lignaria lignaria]|uniref:uncharacterized protein LOC117609807 isoform X4 n=1 Tax=Osmia lignaria lignaria TaxID=1437193 RepID=UPI0014793457|nr:uncharacterized protein LOC117609807 isoform X4 [Osmia lignaria]
MKRKSGNDSDMAVPGPSSTTKTLDVDNESGSDSGMAVSGSSSATKSLDVDNESGNDSGMAVSGPSSAIKILDVDNESGSMFSAPPPKKIFARQKFRDAWLQDSKFASWLKKCDNPYKAKCVVCNSTFTAGKSDLLKHMKTIVHTISMQKRGLEEGDATTEDVQVINFQNDIKKAELRFCLDIIEHSRSFHSFEHFANIIAVPDSPVGKNIFFKRTKISAIIKNVLNKYIVSEMSVILQNKVFSVIVDESTDISGTKNLCILVRYVHEGHIQTYLLDYLRVMDDTAENLYKCFLCSLEKHNLSVTNIVGIGVDNANVMLGKQNLLISHLLEDNEEVSVFPCTSHTMHLIAYHATDCLPHYIEQFLHAIPSYFSKSSKRQTVLENTQQLMKAARKKVIHPAITRWLALSECIEVVLDQWTVLFTVFAEAVIEDKSNTATRIFDCFNCLYTKAYLQFLNYILQIFTHFNTTFQSSIILVHRLIEECVRFLRLLGSNFLQPQCVETNVQNANIYEENNLLPLEDIFIGTEAAITINEIRNINCADSNDKIVEFYRNIRKFYQCSFENAVKRFPLKEQFLYSLEFLDPVVTLDLTKHKNQIDCIINKFKSKFRSTRVANEWRLMPFYFSQEEKQKLLKLDIPRFWNSVSKITDSAGNQIFYNISSVAHLCLTLPHSNADVERFFSLVTKIKTKERNRLKPAMISAVMRIKLHLKNKNKNCVTYEIPDGMLELYNSNMYRST